MKYKVSFVSEAEEDLFQIYKYVYLNDSEDKAEKLYSKLYEKCLMLQEFSEKGNIPRN
ncbi:MAG: type II toxin-antitoxin system RelE/ParE family toxin [Ignavibacteriaceae bacterium]